MKNFVKKYLGGLCRYMPLLRKRIQTGVTIFTFHEVSDMPSEFARDYGLAVSKEQFLKQAQWIQSNFNVVHPELLICNKPLPKRAAVITFDDGFLGGFENGLRILDNLGIPSIFFLNMRAIVKQMPILSATAGYMQKYSSQFCEFADINGIARPYHLHLTPLALSTYCQHHGEIDWASIRAYQGQFATLDTVKKWDNQGSVNFGNHLYDHWNAPALTVQELEDQYFKNEYLLNPLKHKINLFAFTNGQPKTCYTCRDIRLIKRFGARKVFSSSGGVNNKVDRFVLERLGFGPGEITNNHFWFRLARAVLK